MKSLRQRRRCREKPPNRLWVMTLNELHEDAAWLICEEASAHAHAASEDFLVSFARQ